MIRAKESMTGICWQGQRGEIKALNFGDGEVVSDPALGRWLQRDRPGSWEQIRPWPLTPEEESWLRGRHGDICRQLRDTFREIAAERSRWPKRQADWQGRLDSLRLLLDKVEGEIRDRGLDVPARPEFNAFPTIGELG